MLTVHLLFHPFIFDGVLNIQHINFFHIKNMILLIRFHTEIEYPFGGKHFNDLIFSFIDIFIHSRLQLTTKMASEHKPGGHKLWHAMYMARKFLDLLSDIDIYL